MLDNVSMLDRSRWHTRTGVELSIYCTSNTSDPGIHHDPHTNTVSNVSNVCNSWYISSLWQFAVHYKLILVYRQHSLQLSIDFRDFFKSSMFSATEVYQVKVNWIVQQNEDVTVVWHNVNVTLHHKDLVVTPQGPRHCTTRTKSLHHKDLVVAPQGPSHCTTTVQLYCVVYTHNYQYSINKASSIYLWDISMSESLVYAPVGTVEHTVEVEITWEVFKLRFTQSHFQTRGELNMNWYTTCVGLSVHGTPLWQCFISNIPTSCM